MRRARQRDAIVGMTVGLVPMALVVFARLAIAAAPVLAPVLHPVESVAWPWYVLIGTMVTVGSGTIVGFEALLRWPSPVIQFARPAPAGVDLPGTRIRAGDTVGLYYPSANRDDRVFADPYRFDISRSPNHHLAFGHGAHFCLGAGLARLEMRLVLDAVLERVGAIERVGPIEWVRSNKHTGVRHAPVVLHPR